MRQNINIELIDLFIENLWKDNRKLRLAPHREGTVIWRYSDSRTSIKDEHSLLLQLQKTVSFKIPRIFDFTDDYIIYQYISGTRVFNLIKDLKLLHDVKPASQFIDPCIKLLELLKTDLAEFQQKALEEPYFRSIRKKYPTEEKVIKLYELLLDVFSLHSFERDGLFQELEKIIDIYADASVQLFRDATPKNAILDIPGLYQKNFHDRNERLKVVEKITLSGELDNYLIKDKLYHIDFSGCSFRCPESDDWIALLHHEATHWISEYQGNRFLIDEPNYLCTLFVRFSRFGGRKLAYRALNWNGYQIRFGLDNELFYFKVLKEVCERLEKMDVIKSSLLSRLMERLLQRCAVHPPKDYLHETRPELNSTSYYQDIYPN